MSQGKLRTPLFDAMFLAGETSGQGTSTDLNGFKPEGVARLDSTATSTSFWTRSNEYFSLVPLRTHRVRYFAKHPCWSDADWHLQSDVVTNSRILTWA